MLSILVSETIVAVVVAVTGAELTLLEVRDFLLARLTKYKIRRELMIADSLPRNPSGKITKHVLRAEIL